LKKIITSEALLTIGNIIKPINALVIPKVWTIPSIELTRNSENATAQVTVANNINDTIRGSFGSLSSLCGLWNICEWVFN
jgi:hypothetical protein